MLEFSVEVDALQLPVGAENTVTGSGDAVDQNGDLITDDSGMTIVATDDSDSGTDPSDTNNGEPGDTFGSDDPTPLQIPSIGLAKLGGVPAANGDNFDITFTLFIENNGTVSLADIEVFDDLASQFGDAFVSLSNVAVQGFSGSGNPPIVNSGWANDTSQSIVSGGMLDVGDSFQISFTATIDPDASGTSTELENQASANGTGVDANGNLLTDSNGALLLAADDSDNGFNPNSENSVIDTNGDGIYGNDPTPIQIADFGIAKQVVGEPVVGNNGATTYTFQVTVENTGTVNLTDFSLIEDLAAQFGSVLIEAGNLSVINLPTDAFSSVTVNSSWDGVGDAELLDQSATNSLAIGDAFTLQFTTTVSAFDITEPLTNQVVGTATGVDSRGFPLLDLDGAPLAATDLSDSGSNASGANGNLSSDDPTPLPEIDQDNRTTGNPPNFGGGGGGFSPQRFSGIGGPGQFFSSSALRSGTTANPLSLDSSFAGGGGYSGEAGCCFDACADSCGLPTEAQGEIFVEPADCGSGCDTYEATGITPLSSNNGSGSQIAALQSEPADATPIATDEASDTLAGSEGEADNADANGTEQPQFEIEPDSNPNDLESVRNDQLDGTNNKLLKRPSFLKRLYGWFTALSNVES